METLYSPLGEMPRLLTIPEVAESLRISRAHAYNLTNREDFPTTIIGARKLVREDELIAWLANQKRK